MAALTDRRLFGVRDSLAAGRVKVLSVDVFDTLLWRRVPEPKDVHLVLGRRLKALGRLAPHVSSLEFAELRRAAENRAREKKQAVTGYREITLAQIYAELPDFMFSPAFAPMARASAELEFEAGQMILDTDVAALMATAKGAGMKVILVSDTYFSGAEVEEFLRRAGMDMAVVDRVYVSCEMGKPKWRDLFELLLKELGVAPADMLHVGDSPEADILPCRRLGIGTLHYDKWAFSPRARTVEWPENHGKRDALLLDYGDGGLTGLRSRLFNRPPENLPEDLQVYWRYGAATLAPVFAAFARWAAASCADGNVTRIHGIMREGRFLNRIVGETAKSLGIALETEELWLSRRAVIRAALVREDLSLLPEFVTLSPGSSLAGVLKTMGLEQDDLSGHVSGDFDLSHPQALVILCRAIASTPALLDKVLAVSARHRKNLLKALSPVLDSAAKSPAVVMDLGYAGTIQSVLEKILARESHPARFTGLYLALNAKAVNNLSGGADLRAYLNAEGYGEGIAALLSRTPDVLEHACMCREGSLSEFDDKGEKVLLPNQRDETQLKQMEALQDGIAAGVTAINALLGDLRQTPAATPALKAQAADIIAALMLHPTPQEAATIGAWRHEANFDLADKRRLTDLAIDPARLEYQGFPALQELGRHQVYWPAAAFAAAEPFIAEAFAAGTANAYKAEQLQSGPILGGLTISPDLGVGFDAKREGTVALSVNAFGRGQLDIALKPFGVETYQRLRFRWPKARAVAAITGLTLAYVGEQDRRHVETFDAAKGLAWSGGTELELGVHLLKAGGAEVVAETHPPSWPHALELTLRFKYLRLDGMFGAR